MSPLAQWPGSEQAGLIGILTDIDDTLTSDGAITPDALQALAALKAAGLHVIPITGRPVGWSEPFAASWPVDAIVAENGAVALLPAVKNNGQIDLNSLSSKREQLSKKKLSYKEQRELEQLPVQIAALETEQQALQGALADGSLYSTDPARAAAMTARAGAIEDELMTALERWTALSA